MSESIGSPQCFSCSDSTAIFTQVIAIGESTVLGLTHLKLEENTSITKHLRCHLCQYFI